MVLSIKVISSMYNVQCTYMYVLSIKVIPFMYNVLRVISSIQCTMYNVRV